jgi:alpha-tubulin suppressor-like RCC1 family protein
VAAVQVAGISGAVRVAVRQDFACAVTRDAVLPGALWCWGKNYYGVSNSNTPWRVEALAGNVLDVTAGTYHVCALVEVATGSGDVYCWGYNANAQLGQGYANTTINSWNYDNGVMPPMRVKALSKVTALFASGNSVCALTVSQRVVCWGRQHSREAWCEH